MLADHAEVADGKLFINGGGWTFTGPGPCPFAIAMTAEMPRDSAGAQHDVRWELLDDQGHPVVIPTPNGHEPLVIQGQFAQAAGPDAPEGVPLTSVLAINLGPTPIPPGGRYEWRLMIDGETHEDWRLGFNTRPMAQSNVG
jgi:hypothetical protein